VLAVRDRFVTGALLLLPAIAGGLALAVWWPGTIAIAVVLAFAVAHVIVIPNPSGRVVPLVPAVAAGTALVTVSPVLVLGGAAVALPIGWFLARLRHGRRVVSNTFPAEPIGLAVFSSVFFAGTSMFGEPEASHPLVLSFFGLAALAWFTTAVVVRSGWSQERRTVTSRVVRLWALADWPAYAALFASASLFPVTVDAMEWWSIPPAGLPYLFSHLSLDRVQGTRRTYDQTIRALGAIPEASGQVAEGHSGRTGDLAIAVGSELGLGAGSLRRLEYAAVLHDIGRVVLSNPAVARGEYSFADVSGWSAAIISEARYLEPVAQIVASMHAPYRRPGEHRDPNIPIGSQIVRVAARYDSALDDGISPIEAMELLHKGVAYDYDPEIVMALRRVLERTGEIAA
jgi:hypothetical protein